MTCALLPFAIAVGCSLLGVAIRRRDRNAVVMTTGSLLVLIGVLLPLNPLIWLGLVMMLAGLLLTSRERSTSEG